MQTTQDLYRWQATLVRHSAHLLAHYVESTRADRLMWRPRLPESAETRSAFELVFECTRLNRRFAMLLRGETPPPRGTETHPYHKAEDAMKDLVASAEELATTIEHLDDSALLRTYETGLGPVKGKFLLEMPVNNMYYHGGQLNLIQLLYGDPEFHVPKDFTEI